jgi:predicted RNA-binding Zn ribbon-like protein
MSWHWVDGVAVPDAVGGHPALDFCNTRAGWGGPRPKEYLVSPQALVIWCREAGGLDPDLAARLLERARADPAAAGTALRTALALREALYPVVLGRGGPQAWDRVSRAAAIARAADRLVPVPPGELLPDAGPAAWRRADRGGLEPALAGLAVAAADLLTSPAGAAVSACPGVGCGWVFTDPRRRRRWCSMAVCGNRAKARRFVQRRREALGTGPDAAGLAG